MTLRAPSYIAANPPGVWVVVPNAHQLGTYDHRVWIEACGPPDIRCGLCSGGENDSMGATYVCDDCEEAELEARERERMEWEADNG